MHPNPVVVSVCTDISKAHNLIKSCQKYEWPLHLVQIGQWVGWGDRLKTVLAQIPQLKDQGYTHLIHVDAYDVVAVRKKSNDDCNFLKNCCKNIVFAAESNCWPDSNLRNHSIYKNSGRASPWRYAHSQFCLNMTTGLAIEKGFGKIPDDYDDQLHCHEFFLTHYNELKDEEMSVDYYCHFFQSIAFCHPYYTYFSVDNGIFCNRITNHWPAFIHGNGQTDMSWVLPLALGESNNV